jgi:hypothetical protein
MFVDALLSCYIPLSHEHLLFRKLVARSPLRNICSSIENLNFGDSTIELLLYLTYEIPVSMKNLPHSADIKNEKVLPFLHQAIKHLHQHSVVFRNFNLICLLSSINKLHVFQSKLPTSIIHFVSSFEVEIEISKQQNDSISSLFTLFSTVSSMVFKWSTFYELIQALRVGNGCRSWWTIFFISCLTNILTNIPKDIPKSFFHLENFNVGLTCLNSDLNSLSKIGLF